jgi:phosphoribosylamine-glycine ligase
VILPYDDLDESVRKVNAWLSPALAEYRYRGLFSTEVRVGPDEQPYLIDVTARGGSPPSESMQEMISNWAEIMWHGAEGKMIDPVSEDDAKYSAQAVVYSDHADEAWQPVNIPDEVRRWVKLFFHCRLDGIDYVIPQPAKFSEIGWVVGTGKTVKDAIKACEEHADQVTGYKLEIRTSSLQAAVEEIEKGEALGVQFSDEKISA